MRAYFDGGPVDGETRDVQSTPTVLMVPVMRPMDIWLKEMETVPNEAPMISEPPAVYHLAVKMDRPGATDVIYVWDGSDMDDEDDDV